MSIRIPEVNTNKFFSKQNFSTRNIVKQAASDGFLPVIALEAFVEAVITRKQPARIAEEGYYASMLCLLGHQALEEERTLYFPDEYKIDYLNHQSVKTPEAI